MENTFDIDKEFEIFMSRIEVDKNIITEELRERTKMFFIADITTALDLLSRNSKNHKESIDTIIKINDQCLKYWKSII